MATLDLDTAHFSAVQAAVVNSQAFYDLEFDLAESLRAKLVTVRTAAELSPDMREIVQQCLDSGPFSYDHVQPHGS